MAKEPKKGGKKKGAAEPLQAPPPSKPSLGRRVWIWVQHPLFVGGLLGALLAFGVERLWDLWQRPRLSLSISTYIVQRGPLQIDSSHFSSAEYLDPQRQCLFARMIVSGAGSVVGAFDSGDVMVVKFLLENRGRASAHELRLTFRLDSLGPISVEATPNVAVGHEVLRSLDKSVHVVTIQTLPPKTLSVITARMRVTAAPTSGRTYTVAFLSPTLTTREQPTRVFRASQIPPLEALGQEGRLTNTNDLFGEQIRIHSSVPGRTPGTYPIVMRLYEREGLDRLTRPTTCGYREGGPTPLPVESLPRDSAMVRVRI